MAQRVSGYERVADDRYETPNAVTMTIVPYLQTRTLHIWEPATAPSDAMDRTLRRAGFKVMSTSGNFLSYRAAPADDITCVVTNPPYGSRGKTACYFVEHGLELAQHVVMLLPIDFVSAKSRAALFRDCPAFAHKVVLLGRVEWFPGRSSPPTNHAWFCWDRKHHSPPTIGYATIARDTPLLDLAGSAAQIPRGSKPVRSRPGWSGYVRR
jgi:hypothetical protein